MIKNVVVQYFSTPTGRRCIEFHEIKGLVQPSQELVRFSQFVS